MEVTARTKLVVTVYDSHTDDLKEREAVTAASTYAKLMAPFDWEFEDIDRKAYNKIDVYFM